MQNRLRLMMWPALLLALFVAACGTKNVGVNGPNLTAQQQSQRASAGVTVGGFEVIRQNQKGNNDPALNGTLQLALKDEAGEKALVINVRDTVFTNAVTVDVNYDATRFHPTRTVFGNLLGQPDQVLTAAILHSMNGTAGIAAAAIGDYTPPALSGQFATVYFAAGADHSVSNLPGDAHENPTGVGETLANVNLPNLTATSDDATKVASVTWTAAWMIGNGDANKEVNGADLVPIAKHLKQDTGVHFDAVEADYDRNSEANGADITQIAKYFKRFTDSYLVEASDDDDAGKVTVTTLDGATDQLPAVPPVDNTKLTSVIPFWQVTFDSTSAFTYTQLAALDLNNDGNVKLTITPQGQTGKLGGVPASILVGVGSTPPPPVQNNLVIDGFSIEVNDGGAPGTPLATLDDTNPSFSGVANAGMGFKLKTIKGSWNGKPFDGGPAAPSNPPQSSDMTQADYDLAYNAAIANTIWTFSNSGDSAARRTASWLTFPSGSSPYLGTLPTGGILFPDYDPESNASDPVPDPEGTLNVVLPENGGSLPGGGTATYPDTSNPAPGVKVQILGGPVSTTFHLDVTRDPLQAILPIYQDSLGSQLNQLTLNRRNEIYMNGVIWGDRIPDPNNPPPATIAAPAPDFTTTTMQLMNFDTLTGDLLGSPVNLTYTLFDPGNGHDIKDMSPGQFTVFQGLNDPNTGDPTYIAVAVINGGQLLQGGHYALRMGVAGKFSSVNLPADLMTTQPPPPPQPLEVVPSALGEQNDQIQVFYSNTIIRRNGDVKLVFSGGPPPQPTFVPVNQDAFDDILRTNNATQTVYEFSPSIDAGVQPPTPDAQYPRVVIKNDANGPITDMNDPGAEPTPVLQRGAGRIVLSVASLTPGGGAPGDPTVTYNISVFDQGGVPLGTGQFVFIPGGNISPQEPILLQWGVNVFNREDRDWADRHYDEGTVPEVHTVDGTNLKNPAFDVPVLFFEFYGGGIFDWQQNEEDTQGPNTPNNNLYVYLKNDATSRDEDMMLGLRAAGVTPDGTYLCIHTLTLNDFIKPGTPGWFGILDPGETYTLWLVDPPSNSGQTVQFADKMEVTGSNPNF